METMSHTQESLQKQPQPVYGYNPKLLLAMNKVLERVKGSEGKLPDPVYFTDTSRRSMEIQNDTQKNIASLQQRLQLLEVEYERVKGGDYFEELALAKLVDNTSKAIALAISDAEISYLVNSVAHGDKNEDKYLVTA